MSGKRQPAQPAEPGGQGKPTGQAVDPQTRVVGVSRRIWVALVLLGALLVYTGFGMFMARGELDEWRASAKEAELKLEAAIAAQTQAQADKEQVIKELAEQGKRLAEFSRGEEQAKSGAEEATKRVAELEAQLAKVQKQARSARRAQGQVRKLKEEVLALQTALDGTRAELEATQVELEKARAAAEPYSTNPQVPGAPPQ